MPVSTYCIDLNAIAAHPALDAEVSDFSLLGGIATTLATIEKAAALGQHF